MIVCLNVCNCAGRFLINFFCQGASTTSSSSDANQDADERNFERRKNKSMAKARNRSEDFRTFPTASSQGWDRTLVRNSIIVLLTSAEFRARDPHRLLSCKLCLTSLISGLALHSTENSYRYPLNVFQYTATMVVCSDRKCSSHSF